MPAAVKVDVLIVGTGHGGAATAIALRKLGFSGSIMMVGNEADPPYERPPLSKEYLVGTKELERMLIRPRAFWPANSIQLLLSTEVIAIDAAAHTATLSDGSAISYCKLVWAAGGKARRLSCDGHDLLGVHSIRNRRDVEQLKGDCAGDNARVAVIGGGYIGLEAASALTKTGASVVVVEALDRVLARVSGEPVSRYFEQLHRDNGVDIRLGAAVASIEGANGRATAVRLENGERIEANVVIVGISIEPAMIPFSHRARGTSRGVFVDAFCRTDVLDVFAIGDCAAHANRFAGGEVIRLESVQNANDMGATVARAIVGAEAPYDAVPWFWSIQHDVRLQTVGLNLGYDETLTRGSPAKGTFSIIYLKNETVIALDCVNSTKDYVQGRKLVEEGCLADRRLLVDVRAELKDCLPGA